jgi:hypothetical protein
MRAHLTLLRGALVLLLAGSAVLFFVGSTIERNHRHHEAPAAETAPASSTESGSETGAESSGKSSEAHSEPVHAEAGVRILGVNTESLTLSIVAVVLSLLLAAGVWLGAWAKLVLVAVAGFGLVFAAGDGREVVHQVGESNGGLAAVAAVLIALHVGTALLAGVLFARGAKAGDRPLIQRTS